jgi:PAS domain S-box-containing protein
MKDSSKTNQKLLVEIATLKKRIKELEQSEDIHKVTEEALRQKTALLEAQLNSSIEGILVVDSQGKKVLQNQRTIDLWKIPKHIAENSDDQMQVDHIMHMTKNPKQFVEKIVYLYSHPDETSRDEVELTDGTVLDRYSAPVLGKDGKYYGRIWAFRDITGRKRSEETSRTNQLQLSEAMGLANIVYWEFDPVSQTFVFNDPFYAFYGTTAEQEGGYLVSREDYEKRFMHPDDIAPYHQFRKENALRPDTELIPDLEHRIIRRNGEVRHILVRGRIIRDDSGRIVRRYGANQDITERKQIEEALRENERKLQAIMDAAPIGISFTDMEGNIEYHNHKFFELFGYTLEDIPNIAEWRRRAYPDPAYRESLAPLVPAMIEAQKQGKTVAPIEVAVTCKDGSVRYVEQRGAIADKRFLALYSDLTERKQMEEALRESENKFRDLVEKSLVGVYMLQDNLFKYVNSQFAEILGYTIEEMVDKMGPSETTFSEDRQMVNDNIQQRLTGKVESTHYEFRIVTKQREVRNVAVYGTNTIYKGKPATIGTLLDITEQKHAEEMLMNLFKDLEKKNTELKNTYSELRESQQKILQQEKMVSIGQLAAGIAHEINNPVGFVMSNLNSMGKYSERLSQFIKMQSEAIEKLTKEAGDTAAILDSLRKKRQALKIDFVANDLTNIIKESLEGTERVKRIVRDLKDFSYIDKNEYEAANINKGIESTINVVWNELKYKADVKKEYGKIPLTKCNIGQLNQVFMNLLVNAAHAIEKHGEITVKTELMDGDIVVSVSDTGSGIPEDKINRIFEPFFTTKEVGKGTGLGLSIAYDIVKKHNGKIQVTSEVGKGSTFTIKIPVVEH